MTPSTAVHPPQPCVCIPLLSCCNFVPPFIPYFFLGCYFIFAFQKLFLLRPSLRFFVVLGFFFIFFRFLPSFF